MKRIVQMLVLLGLALSLASCGGPSTSLSVTFTDFEFSPNTFTVPAGKQISVSFHNNGGAMHSFVIMKLGHEIGGHFTDADVPNVYWEKLNIESGQSAKDSFTAPSEPGTYQIVCSEPNHFESGMVARLIVVKP